MLKDDLEFMYCKRIVKIAENGLQRLKLAISFECGLRHVFVQQLQVRWHSVCMLILANLIGGSTSNERIICSGDVLVGS